MVPSLHAVLKLRYGSQIHRNLNSLSTLLHKLAVVATGLAFLLQCKWNNVYPAFVMHSVRFTCTGRHLERLANKLPCRILCAAIRDVCVRLSGLQKDVDDVWLDLYSTVTDTQLWNILVTQKDRAYFSMHISSTARLSNKLGLLFAAQLNRTGPIPPTHESGFSGPRPFS